MHLLLLGLGSKMPTKIDPAEFLIFCIFSKVDCRTWYVNHLPFYPNIRYVAVFVCSDCSGSIQQVADRRFDFERKGVSTGGEDSCMEIAVRTMVDY
jgi:hypothetical protein